MKKVIVTHPFSKTRNELVEICIDKMRKGGGFLYILPSRESIFEVREKILNSNHGIVNSDIATFYDLEKRVLEGAKGEVNALSDIEVKIILRRAVGGMELKFFNNIAEKKGFINQVYSIIKILKRNNIKPEAEEALISSIEDSVIKDKLQDIFGIYRNYEVLKGNFKDVDDISMESSNFANCEFINSKDIIIIDGYINIDPVDMDFTASLLKSYTGDVIITVPFTNQLIYDFIEKEIIIPFKRLGFSIELNTEFSPENCLQELAFKFGSVEKMIYSPKSEIVFNDSPCIEDEVRRCGRFIKDRLLNDNIDINNVAVAVNSEDYRYKILEIFEEYGIPLRIPSIINLSETGLFKEVLALLRLEHIKDSALRQILSSPFFSRNERVYQILLMHDFNRDIYLNTNNGDEELFSREEAEYAFELYSQIIHLLDIKKDKDSIDYIKYALEYLKVEENALSLSVDNIKAYLTMSSLIDDIKNIRDRWGLNLKSNQLQEILIEGASGLGITIKKSKPYGVNILNTDHFKGNKYKLVCALGLNEGVIPSRSRGDSIFSLNEREYLKTYISLISPSFELGREKIRFNIMLSAAKDMLYLSYLNSSDSGDYMIKSPYLSEIQRMLSIKEEAKKRNMRDRFNLSRDQIASLREASFYCNTKNVDDFTIRHFRIDEYNPIRNIKAIGKEDTSPRKIENYGLCPFRFLVEDMMNIKDISSDDFKEGNICHNVLKEYYKAFGSKEELSEEDYFKIFDNVLNKYGIDAEVYLNRVLIDELRDILKSFITSDIEIFNNFRSVNKDIEVKYLEKVNKKLEVSGRVDRVDLVLENGSYTGEYIIHDYKFSASYTDIKNISNLEKLQLAVYRWMMDEEIEGLTGKEAKCIALLYRPLKKALNGERTLHGVVLKEYGKLFGFKGAAHFIVEENLGKLYDHLDEAIHDIRLLIKTGKINTVSNCNMQKNYMYPCPVRNLCREGVR